MTVSLIARIAKPQAAASTIENLMRSVYGGSTSATGITVNTDSAMRVGAVYTCVLVLSQSVAQLPLHEYEKSSTSKSKATNHYLYDLVHDQPNEWMTSYEMKQLVMVHLLLRGNSIWLKAKVPGQRKIRELIPFHPNLIQGIQQDSKYRLSYKVKRPNSTEIDTIPGDRVVHFRGLSMDGFSGLSPLEYAREMIGLSIATEKHGAKLFANGARLGGILSHPTKISEGAHERLIKSFNEAYTGVENAHKTALIEEGMTWNKVTMTAEDSQFLDTRKYQRSEIAGFYRVPSHMINDLEKATFSNVEHLDLAFVKHSLMPWLVSFEQTLKKDCMTDEEKKKYYFKFSVEGLLRGDIKSRNEAHQKAVMGGWLNRNEVRETEDRNPVDGLEEFLEPMNMQNPGDSNESKTTA